MLLRCFLSPAQYPGLASSMVAFYCHKIKILFPKNVFKSPFFSSADCSDRFNDAALDLSDHVNPTIRKILDNFVENVKTTKPCMFRGDLDCLEDNLRNVGLVGLQNAQRSAAKPPLRQLFARLYAKDSDTLRQLQKLQNGEIIPAAFIICDMFNYKTSEIRQYLSTRN